MQARFICLLGLLVFILLAWLISSHRRRFPVRVVAGGLLLQLLLGFLVLRTTAGRLVFEKIGDLFTSVLDTVSEGSGFLFGAGGENPLGESLLGTFCVWCVADRDFLFIAYEYSVLSRTDATNCLGHGMGDEIHTRDQWRGDPVGSSERICWAHRGAVGREAVPCKDDSQ